MPNSFLNRGALEGAVRGDKSDSQRFFKSVADELDAINHHIGRSQQFDNDKKKGAFAVKPPNCPQWKVQGIDGKYVIDITVEWVPKSVKQNLRHYKYVSTIGDDRTGDPFVALGFNDLEQRGDGRDRNTQKSPFIFQIQTSKNTLFDVAGGVTTYGPFDVTHVELQDPNATKYLRLRIKYQNSDWSAWCNYVDQVTCGVIALWSGTMRTLGVNRAISANTYTGASPLSQSGTSTQVNIAASTWKEGALVVNYNSGSVDPGAYQKSYIYLDDPKRAGGTQIYVATTNVADVTSSDSRIYFGSITTTGGGGAVPVGGGSGACLIGDCEVTMANGRKKLQKNVRKGESVRGEDGEAEIVEDIELIPDQPCFRITGENGFILKGCSSSHLLKHELGGWERAFELHYPDVLRTVQGGTKIRKEFIGNHTVYRMKLRGTTSQTFIADGYVNHNLANK